MRVLVTSLKCPAIHHPKRDTFLYHPNMPSTTLSKMYDMCYTYVTSKPANLEVGCA